MEVAVAIPMLLLLFLGVVEFGRVWYLQNETEGAAQAGAIYGTQNPTDTTGMQTVAKDNAPDVSSAGDVTGFKVSSSWGCECSDGTNASASCSTYPSCTVNAVDYATVTVSGTYKPFFTFPGLPSSIPLSASVTMRGAPQ